MIYFVLDEKDFDDIVNQKKTTFLQPLSNTTLVGLVKKKIGERDCDTGAFISWYRNNLSKPFLVKIAKKVNNTTIATLEVSFTIEEDNFLFSVEEVGTIIVK